MRAAEDGVEREEQRAAAQADDRDVDPSGVHPPSQVRRDDGGGVEAMFGVVGHRPDSRTGAFVGATLVSPMLHAGLRGRDKSRPYMEPTHQPSFFRNSPMRSRPLSICSMLVAKLSRTCVSKPLSLPGTTATWLCSSRAELNEIASVIFVPPI